MDGPHIILHEGTTYRLAGEQVEMRRAGELLPRTLSCTEAEALPEAIRSAFVAFWVRLRAAPCVTVEADQWRSTYRTELDGWRYTWWEDRHDPAEGLTAERIEPKA